jgi:hypothetical protein
MTEPSSSGMPPSLRHHDRKTLWTYVAMLSASLTLSATILAHAMRRIGSVDVVLTGLWHQVVTPPLIIGGLWFASLYYARKRPWSHDGRDPTNPDDLRNLARLASAGYLFVTGFGLIAIAGQAYWVLLIFDVVQPPGGAPANWWMWRAMMLAAGLLMVQFGNISPRMPAPRVPEANPAVRMKWNRLTGWMYVASGALLALSALFTPSGKLLDTIGGLGILLLLVMTLGYALYCREMKPQGRT